MNAVNLGQLTKVLGVTASAETFDELGLLTDNFVPKSIQGWRRLFSPYVYKLFKTPGRLVADRT